MNKEDYNVNILDGWIKINTLSNSSFYYKIQNPIELNKSAFGVRIAFFAIGGELIYNRNNYFAHELNSKEEIDEMKKLIKNEQYDLIKPKNNLEFVKWSKEGNMAYFLEYSNYYEHNYYESVFINLKQKYCYRIKEFNDATFVTSQINPIKEEFNEEKVDQIMSLYGVERHPLISQNFHKRTFFFSFKKIWYPDI